MSYSAYQYPYSGSSYDTYAQQSDPQPYTDQHAHLPQYDYTPTQPLDHFAPPTAAPAPMDYGGYNSAADTGYIAPPVTSYPDTSISHPSYQYNQDIIKTDQFSSHSSDIIPVSYSTPASHYSSGTLTQDQTTSQPVSDYSYQYQPTDYNQTSSSFGQDSTSSGYTGSYSQNSSSYSYQDEPSQPSNTWTSNDQYTYNPGYYEEESSGTSYQPKVESGYGSTDYSPSVDRFSHGSSVDSAGDNSQSGKYSVIEGSSYHDYVKPISSGVSKPQYDYAAYCTPGPFKRASENKDMGDSKSYSSEKGGISVAPFSSPSYYSGTDERQGGRSNYQGGNRDNFVNRGSSGRFTGGQKFTYPTHQTTTTQRSFNNNQSAGRGSSFSTRGFSNRGAREGASPAKGAFLSPNHGDRRSNVNKPPLVSLDARNKINEARSANTALNKLTRNVSTINRNITNLPPSNNKKVSVPPFKPPESNKKEVFKAPSRPQDRLLNEIEEKEKAQRAEELKKSEEEKRKAEEAKLKDLEKTKKVDEALKIKEAEEARKSAPPSKLPETPEEIAHEEEIQRKIRESLVLINPEQEIALMKDDPSKDIDMPEELRKLLKSQTTDYLCKLCSVRIVSPQMAAMHYNGKNHLKKIRNFVQTNGRSAGFNLETLNKPEKDEQKRETTEEKKTEIVEITVMETAIDWRSGQG